MAKLIPGFAQVSQRMTSGERRFAQRLQQLLEDDYYCWFNISIGRNLVHPDFVVLHPRRGIFVLEVKDWDLRYIHSADRETFAVLEAGGIRLHRNPLAQARDYALTIANLLETDPALVQKTGRHQGKLICPYGYGVVFPNITRRQYESVELSQIIPGDLVICRDEMLESVDPLHFQERIWNMARYDFGPLLSLPQVDRIRWHLFPEIRIDAGVISPQIHQEVLMPDIIRVMDSQQELLARSLGEGHRIIHGVSGSGKTMILAYRALKLVEQYDKPILVLCFNVTLASRLRQMMSDRGVAQRVSVHHFHDWCKAQLVAYGIPQPRWNPDKRDQYLIELVEKVIQGVDRQQIPAGQYAALLIDEGHDFQEDWLRLLVQMVDPKTNSLLLLYDDAQNLYGKEKRRLFSFKSVGIQAQGRTTILKLNYRNTQEILAIAYEFAKEMMLPKEVDEDGVPLVQPESVGRHGPAPELVEQPSFNAEVNYLVHHFKVMHDEQGIPWSQMAIVYRTSWTAQTICKVFENQGLPLEWVNRNSVSRRYNPNQNSVKLLTMHSSKGLEFPIVAIPGLGYLPHTKGTLEDETRLLYVAMTRAMEQLVMTYHRRSEFVKRLMIAREKTLADSQTSAMPVPRSEVRGSSNLSAVL